MMPHRRLLFLVTLILCCGVSNSANAGVPEEIEAIEKLPRIKRLSAYEALADRKKLTNAERLQVVQAFAVHLKKLSPEYGENAPKLNSGLILRLLAWGHKQDANHADTAEALCQLLIDQRNAKDAESVANAFLKAHPNNHEAKAYVEWCSRVIQKSPLPDPLGFPLHFCVLTSNPQAQKVATEEQCRREVEIFNESFRSRENKPLVKFTFKSFKPAVSAQGALAAFGDSQQPFNSDKVAEVFNATADTAIRDPHAINVYIFDSFSSKEGFKDLTSHGKRNSNRPFVLIDLERLGSNIQNAEPHEMGHAFGLEHVGVLGAKLTTSTNIMTSAAEDFGSGGKRDLGFSESQCAIVLYHAKRTYSRLDLGKR